MYGKSAILKGLRIAASTFLSKLGGAIGIDKDEHRVIGSNPFADFARECSIEVEAEAFVYEDDDWHVKQYAWRRYRNSRGENTKLRSKQNDLPQDALQVFDRVIEHQEGILPVFLYLGTEYIHQRHASNSDFFTGDAKLGYRYCFSEKSMENGLFEWLKSMRIAVEEQAKSKAANLYLGDLPQNSINAFSKVLKSVLPDIQSLAWVRKPLGKKEETDYDIVFELSGGDVCSYNMLSDGYKYIVLLCAELSARALFLNKHLGADVHQKVNGIVLIDEFGIHLHPDLQNETLKRLSATFPHIQFFVSTHSPMLVNGLDKEQIFKVKIDKNKKRYVEQPARDVVGLGSDGILTELFDLETTFDEKTIQKNNRFMQLKKKRLEQNGFSEAEEAEFAELLSQLSAIAYDSGLEDRSYAEFAAQKSSLLKNSGSQKLSQKEHENLLKKLLGQRQ
jgi:predicted ATP-binding protein involved in virulence